MKLLNNLFNKTKSFVELDARSTQSETFHLEGEPPEALIQRWTSTSRSTSETSETEVVLLSTVFLGNAVAVPIYFYANQDVTSWQAAIAGHLIGYGETLLSYVVTAPFSSYCSPLSTLLSAMITSGVNSSFSGITAISMKFVDLAVEATKEDVNPSELQQAAYKGLLIGLGTTVATYTAVKLIQKYGFLSSIRSGFNLLSNQSDTLPVADSDFKRKTYNSTSN